MCGQFAGRRIRETPNDVAAAVRSAWLAATIAFVTTVFLGLVPESVVRSWGLGWLGASVGLSPLLRRLAKRSRESPVDVQIDADGIRIGTRLVMARRRMRSGAMHMDVDGRIRVVFQSGGVSAVFGAAPLVAFFATDTADAYAMLAAARIDAERQIFRATFLRPGVWWQAICALIIGSGLFACFTMTSSVWVGFADRPAAVLAPFWLASVVAFGTYVLIARTTVSVGTDGVEVCRALRKRFLPLDQIRDVIVLPNAIELALTSGQTVSLVRGIPMEPVRFDVSDIGIGRALLGDRIVEAVRLHRARRCQGSAVSMLGRNSRSIDEWLASVSAVGLAAIDYRTVAMPVKELQRVVLDGTAASDVRIGAALALRVAPGADGCAQIRIAAETTASTELRRVLLGVATGTDEADVRRHLSSLI
jgi:hypothetical protein